MEGLKRRRPRLAEGTVKVHLHHIYRKLGIANRTELAVLAHTKTFERLKLATQLPWGNKSRIVSDAAFDA
jgi:Bacterial regulatory proteins, luxR family